jgi:hypothetical protein
LRDVEQAGTFESDESLEFPKRRGVFLEDWKDS